MNKTKIDQVALKMLSRDGVVYPAKAALHQQQDDDFPRRPWSRRQSLALKDRKGGDPAEWPEDLRVREMPR